MAAKQMLWGLATGSDPLLSLIREGVYSTSTDGAHSAIGFDFRTL
jgi:hypothetical protein